MKNSLMAWFDDACKMRNSACSIHMKANDVTYRSNISMPLYQLAWWKGEFMNASGNPGPRKLNLSFSFRSGFLFQISKRTVWRTTSQPLSVPFLLLFFHFILMFQLLSATVHIALSLSLCFPVAPCCLVLLSVVLCLYCMLSYCSKLVFCLLSYCCTTATG
jgi:hypothetical protein